MNARLLRFTRRVLGAVGSHLSLLFSILSRTRSTSLSVEISRFIFSGFSGVFWLRVAGALRKPLPVPWVCITALLMVQPEQCIVRPHPSGCRAYAHSNTSPPYPIIQSKDCKKLSQQNISGFLLQSAPSKAGGRKDRHGI
jgi:hypothetical protein